MSTANQMSEKMASLFTNLGFGKTEKDGDAKYFQRGKIQELRAELNADTRNDPKFIKKKIAMKKVVANMTMGNDMSPLFPDVINCLNLNVLEVKKMVYLYLVHYAKSKPDMALSSLPALSRDALDSNPLLRAMAVRTMSYINVDKVTEAFAPILRTCLVDTDPYVRKTAVMSVPKVYMHDPNLIEGEGFMEILYNLLNDPNAMVLSNTVAALTEISDRSEVFDFSIDISMANKLMTAVNDCTEWGQVYILEGLMFYAPQTCEDAEQLAERVLPRLQHANSGVILAAVKVIMYLMNYIQREEALAALYKKLAPPLVTLLHNGYEVQYVALRNILLVIQKKPDVLAGDMKVFFCKYNDPIYVKLAKLEIMIRLTNETNVDQVISELKEYSSEVDVDFLKKSVRALGRCAIKVPHAADKCVKTLVDLIQTKVDYVVQEAVVVIKDIFRRYPNRYESIISTLCENLDSLDAPEAKASMIWIIGQYADRIENAHELLDGFMSTFKEEPTEVQLALLTAIMKLFIKRPTAGQDLVPRLLKLATEETDNPDLRDRAFIYWRLLSTDPIAAKSIILGDKPPISTETDNLESSFLDDMCLYLDTLGAVYHKLPTSFIGNIKPRKLIQTVALNLNNLHRDTNGFDDGLEEDAEAYQAGPSVNPYTSDVRPLNVATRDYEDLADPGEDGPFEDASRFGRLSDPITPVSTFPRMELPKVEPPVSPPTSYVAPAPVAQLSAPIPTQPTQQPQLAAMQASQRLVGSDGSAASPGYVAPKVVMLQSQNGKGMEISGTFARRQANVFLEMVVANRSTAALTDFAIKINRNTFGLVAGPLNMPPLLPGTNAPVAVQLAVDPNATQVMTPLNLLQVAIKSNAGVSYFAAQIPLHVLFVEQTLDQGDWLRMWREELPDSLETKIHMSGLSYPSVEAIRNKLNLNNVFTVAVRLINGMHHIYSSATLTDGSVFLTELTLNTSLQQGALTVKTSSTPYATLFLSSVSDILHSNQ